MKKLKLLAVSLFAVLGLLAVPLAVPATTVSAASPKEELCKGTSGRWTGSECVGNNSDGTTLPQFLQKIVNVFLFLIGAISVLMIVIGGIRYVISGGDQKAVTDAKNTILYAVVGLVVAFMAYAIVNFVIGAF